MEEKLIQLVDANDVIKKRGIIKKNGSIKNEEATNTIPLIESDDIIDESKAPKINKKEKIIIKENAEKNKKYHLLRWEIKKFLIKENIIRTCISWETILDVFDPEIVNKDDLTDIEIKATFNKYGYSLIEHHTKYKDIHGSDETVWMTRSEHRNLHIRIRKEGKCNVSPEELANISLKVNKKGERFLNRIKEYDKTEKKKIYRYKYYRENVKRKVYFKTLEPNVRLYEELSYNIMTSTLTLTSGFRGDHGIKLPIIQID